MSEAAIAVEGLVKRYGGRAVVDGVSLAVRPGELVALLGPNGAGKTTLISTLAGLVRPTSGSLRVMGHDVVGDYRNARQHIGVVPQELVFDPFFTVRETLRFQSGYFGLRRNDVWIEEVMHHLDLTGKADANMRSLSGGMKRRVLIAQALVHRPPVIVLDEPTAGVDVELRHGLWQFVQRLNAEGHTIVLTTHYLEEAEALCGRIAMLKQGRVVAFDRTADLIRRFQALYVRLRIEGQLPDALDARLVPQPGIDAVGAAAGVFLLQIQHYAEVESVLAALRAGGCAILEMEIVQPDLEEVFVQIMQTR